MKAEITERKFKKTKFENILHGEVFEYNGVLYIKADTSVPVDESCSALSLALETGCLIRLLDDTEVIRLSQIQHAKFERLEPARPTSYRHELAKGKQYDPQKHDRNSRDDGVPSFGTAG